MNANWRGQFFATLFFGFAALMIFNPKAFPARTWFNSVLSSLFGWWN